MSSRTQAAERTRLSREAVADGALALIEAEGLDALTIRRLAGDLGVTPMALYWHFKNKDELLAGVSDRLWSLVDTEVDPDLPWLEQLRALMTSLLTALRAHPATTALLTSMDVEKTQCAFRAMEAGLEVFHRAGFSTGEGVELCRHGLSTAIALVTGEPDPADIPDPEQAEAHRRKRFTLETLPPDEFPRIVESAQELVSCADPDGYYEFGIRFFLGGVKALAEER